MKLALVITHKKDMINIYIFMTLQQGVKVE